MSSHTSTQRKTRIPEKLRESFASMFEIEYCSSDQVKNVCTLDNSILQRYSQVDDTFLLRRHRINNKIIRCIRRTNVDGHDLSGFYILYPITKQCERLIEEGFIVGSRQIQKAHICQSFEEASSLYISMVYGRDLFTRAFIVYQIKQDLMRIFDKNKGLKFIYAGPSTSEGILLAKKFKFAEMAKNPELCRHRTEFDSL
jgi:hypothetical protein